MNKQQLQEQMDKFGKKLLLYGFNTGDSGNMSVRLDQDKMLITCKGGMLDEIADEGVLAVNIDSNEKSEKTSVETVVHCMIYKKTGHNAIIHVHSPMAVTLSLLLKQDKIIPLNFESREILKEIPIVCGKSGSIDLAERVSQAFIDHSAVIVKGHGVFAVGKNIKQAYVHTCMAEQACVIKRNEELFKRNEELRMKNV